MNIIYLWSYRLEYRAALDGSEDFLVVGGGWGGQDGSVNNNIEDDKGIYYDSNINETVVYLVMKLV